MRTITRRSLLLSALAASAAANPAKKYRVAVIGHTGHGNYGHGIDTVWNAFSQMEVVAVADPDEKGRAAAVTGARVLGCKWHLGCPCPEYRDAGW